MWGMPRHTVRNTAHLTPNHATAPLHHRTAARRTPGHTTPPLIPHTRKHHTTRTTTHHTIPYHDPPPCPAQPPPLQIGEEIPTNRWNKSADSFFAKTSSQCPAATVPGPNTPSFWLLCSWSHVETQKFSRFSKKIFIFWSTWSLSSTMTTSGSGPVVYALLYKGNGSGSISGPIFFHFLSLVQMGKLVFNAQTKPVGRR